MPGSINADQAYPAPTVYDLFSTGVRPQTVPIVLWYKIVKLTGGDPLTAAFLADSPFSPKYGGSATTATPGAYGRPGHASSPFPVSGCNATTGEPVDPRSFYLYPAGTTWRSGNIYTDAWSPDCGGSCPLCTSSVRMPLWIPAGSELLPASPGSVTPVSAATNLATSAVKSFETTCASSTTLLAPSCSTSATTGCSVDCQYPYQNGDGGSQMRGVALSP